VTCAGHTEVLPELETAEVVVNDRVAPGIGLLVLSCPRVAAAVRPGQFVHVRLARGTDFILRRPFSVHRADAASGRLELLYQVLGTGTRFMTGFAPGDRLDLIGPLGNGWETDRRLEHVLVVAGGLGAAPMGMLVERLAAAGVAITVALGATTADRLLAVDLFERHARRVMIATDDGSAGVGGFVTGLLDGALEHAPDAAFVCGPGPMEHAVCDRLLAAGVDTQVSLERLMACGIGACLSCVVTTVHGQRRACVGGPVFEARDIVWGTGENPVNH
jgi:dihydroorotate dehydrogenase electron transfer subunit